MEINTLSCFDGMSCGQLALNKAGVKYDNYFASEIDKHAIKVTQTNFPNTIQIGDITKIKNKDLPEIDLLIGGSPCQGFSFAGKGLNFEDPRSKLFFEFVRLKNEYKPKYFLLENVVMKKEHKKIISNMLGVEPIFINSKLVSAQDRKRLYWTNIPGVTQPEDKNTSFQDICEDGWFQGSMRGRRINQYGKRDDYNKNLPLIQYIESREDNKTNCLTTVGKDNIVSKTKEKRTPSTNVVWRYLTRNEMERLQNVTDNYTSCVSLNQASILLGNGWTIDVISWIFSFYLKIITNKKLCHMKKTYINSLKLCYTIEKIFSGIVEGFNIKEDREAYPNTIFYFKEDEYFVEYNEKTKCFWCHYDRVWSKFRLNKSFEYLTIKHLLNHMMKEHFKLKEVTTKVGKSI